VHVTPRTNITRYNYIPNKLHKFTFCLKNKKVELRLYQHYLSTIDIWLLLPDTGNSSSRRAHISTLSDFGFEIPKFSKRRKYFPNLKYMDLSKDFGFTGLMFGGGGHIMEKYQLHTNKNCSKLTGFESAITLASASVNQENQSSVNDVTKMEVPS
jgi:hypothetical protein